MLSRKIILVLFFYVFWYTSQILLSVESGTTKDVIDKLHESEFIYKINDYLYDHPQITKFNLILSSLLIDLMVIYIIWEYLVGQSSKTIIIFFTGLICRQVCQYINRLPIPDTMIWFYPGFPSLLVTYTVENDFFFSGHTYVALVAGFTLLQKNNYYAKCFAIFFICYEIFFIIIINGHYFMDIYGAFATYFMLNYFYDKYPKDSIGLFYGKLPKFLSMRKKRTD